jgi:hypothetical protein
VISTSGHAITFVMVEFDNSWDMVPALGQGDGVLYQAQSNDSQLAVVHEAPPGTFTTYFYSISNPYSVFVADDIIHVPQKCVRQEAGNSIKCDGGSGPVKAKTQIDPMALILPARQYVIWAEAHHPHVPKVAEILEMLRSMTAEERNRALDRAGELANYGKVFQEAMKAFKK